MPKKAAITEKQRDVLEILNTPNTLIYYRVHPRPDCFFKGNRETIHLDVFHALRTAGFLTVNSINESRTRYTISEEGRKALL